MKENKEAKISYLAAHLTTIVSVSLVLVIVGVIALITICAANGSQDIKQQIELNAIMTDSATNQQALKILDEIRQLPSTNSASLITKEDALKIWEKETGENLQEVFGVNPLSPEISFTLKAAYTHPDSIKKICNSLTAHPDIEAVATPDATMIETMNKNIEGLSIILGLIATALIVISFVLINNTVHLSIYSRRFTIHTMQLVGATDNFIRRPFIRNNLLSGVIAGVIALCLLGGAVAYVETREFQIIGKFLDWESMTLVIIGLPIFGTLICGIAAFAATSKYLRKEYDQLFK